MEEKQEKRWYVIHTYSGYENKVSANLERKVHSLGMENEIFRIVIPMENEVEIKDGKKRSVQRKVFPGYVLVEMIVNDRSWYAVRNTPGVTGFVGSGSKPIPLTDDEVCAPDFIDKIMALSKAAKPMNDFLNYTFELYGEFPSHCR